MSYLETVNSQIVFAVVKWGAVTREDLYYYLKIKSKFSTFRVRTHFLVSKKLIGSFKHPSQNKPILCVTEGTKALAGNDLVLTHPNLLSHDSALSNICIRLFEMRNVYDISLIRNEDIPNKSSLRPDAELLVSFGEGTINIAIEYELTQKSKIRINEKFYSYSQSKEHQYVLYFFDNERQAVVYANNLHVLTTSKLNQNISFKQEKFFFFVRNKNNEMSDFSKSFRAIFPEDVSSLIKILDDRDLS